MLYYHQVATDGIIPVQWSSVTDSWHLLKKANIFYETSYFVKQWKVYLATFFFKEKQLNNISKLRKHSIQW